MSLRSVLLERHGPLMLKDEYANAMRLSVRTVRRQLSTGTCEVPPALCRPYRWRTEEVADHIAGSTLPEDRRRKAKLARRASAPA